ncbi:4-hydroxyphenyllactate dehydrogenase [Advenella incenata]|uniref:4-hydroxyphenyllactate dehydrogenase n=1 Tax=Advenella incenata TaxID=267800 RepID=A0A4Q7VQG6_9BURK|nr:2-hydroxyacid dehydrogenase [Advenella incenata]RZT98467.1 4-hydroxyphenyllactate dehydrogenase [Advenella incenata]
MIRPILLVVTPFSQEALEPLQEYFDIVQWQSLPAPEAFCAQHGSGVLVLITNGMVGVPPPCRDTLANLALIACNGVGYDAIDLGWADARGIRVINTPDVLSADVADFAMALALAAFRRVPAADRYVRENKWRRQGAFTLTRRFWGSKVGIVGLGRIGHLIARRAAAFDTQIGYTGRRQQDGVAYAYFPTVLALAGWADVLIVATPGGADTCHLVSRVELEALGPEGVLVNIARGSVVNQLALIDCLESGQLGAAALDVFDDEPQVPEALAQSASTVLSPHIASATVQTRQAMAALVVDNILRHINGKCLISPVN